VRKNKKSCPSERRKFFKQAGGLAATLAASAVPVTVEALLPTPAEAKPPAPPVFGATRSSQAFKVRQSTAVFNHQIQSPLHPANGDEDLYPSRIASYSKGLPHNNLGEVNSNAYGALLRALTSRDPADFENIPLGCPDPARQMKLVNPQAGIAFVLQGTDSHAMAIPPAPRFSSAEEAGEMVENYWMALLRDVSFTDYDSNAAAHAAAADLSHVSDFRGPRAGGQVTPGTLFRGMTPGDLKGPYISQFLLQTAPFGANEVVQRMRTYLPGSDFMTTAADWLSVQNGCAPTGAPPFDSVPRHIRNGRDLGEWVHVDVLFQAYFHAMLILASQGAPLNPGNPYNSSQTQTGFGSFGQPHLAAATAEVAPSALKAVWYQKWFVHRRLRPEAFAGRVHHRLTGAANYPIHSDALNSQGLAAVLSLYGTAFLPMGFAEGSPLHPAYGAGHATVAGACVTILKALFDESHPMSNPVVPNADGTSLVPYTGLDAGQLTVGGELNKLASNVAIGRDIAGVHWRTDATESLRLGEALAISILRDQRGTYNESFAGFTFTKFDGAPVTV